MVSLKQSRNPVHRRTSAPALFAEPAEADLGLVAARAFLPVEEAEEIYAWLLTRRETWPREHQHRLPGMLRSAARLIEEADADPYGRELERLTRRLTEETA
jgi:hypothetical protein